jgi:hypothetical protein
MIENAFSLFLVLLVNVGIVSITGTICADSQSVSDINRCSGMVLNSTSTLLKVSTQIRHCAALLGLPDIASYLMFMCNLLRV